jgi:hypothetical protein
MVVLIRYLTQGPNPWFRPKRPGSGPFATNQRFSPLKRVFDIKSPLPKDGLLGIKPLSRMKTHLKPDLRVKLNFKLVNEFFVTDRLSRLKNRIVR